MNSPILSGKGLRKNFLSGDKEIEVLRGVDIELAEAEFISIQGESGSGKTTLLNLLSGLETVDDGEIQWQNEIVSKLKINSLAERRRGFIGLVFQSYYLVPEIDALANVGMGARIAGSSGDWKVRSKALLERVGLSDRMHSMPGTLSGGERQRVAIARALCSKPKIILADEPTGNLDEHTGDSVIELLRSLCLDEKVGLVLVTHNNSHAAMASARYQLKEGILHATE